MSGMLTRAGYDPVGTERIETGKVESAKLSPGAVIVTAMKFRDVTAREFINWLLISANTTHLLIEARHTIA